MKMENKIVSFEFARLKDKNGKEVNKYAIESSLENIEQNLLELISDFLDSEDVVLDEAIGLFSDPVRRDETELHIRMAKAAITEYRKTVIYHGS